MVRISHGVTIKTDRELQIMIEGGKKLAEVKEVLKDLVKEGNNALMIESCATNLIGKTGGKPSFKMVPGYHWSTCINVNEGLVHGIPEKNIVFKDEDVVSVDIGLFYQGFHTDCSFTKAINPKKEIKDFLETGKRALEKSITKIQVGGRIFDISEVIEKIVTANGYRPIKALVGHGVGKDLHEEPAIPCFTAGLRDNSLEIVAGMTLAIEVMYSLGSDEVEILNDGWTIVSRDGKITALFEETVAATKEGPVVLTA